jgi:hypothetical protein
VKSRHSHLTPPRRYAPTPLRLYAFPPRPNAFALPLVILLALVAGLTAGLILQRQGTGSLAVQRQVESYRLRHRNLGMQEIVDRWLQTTRGPIPDRLQRDGLAFELIFKRGERASVYLRDGQGTVLRKLDGLRGAERARGREIVRLLESTGLLVNADGESLFRDAGPLKISVTAAAPEVLRAACQAAAPEGDWERLARELERKRDEGAVVHNDIRSIALAAGFTEEQIAAAEQVLTAEPVLWKVEIEASETDRSGIRRIERHGGLLEVPPPQAAGPGLSTRFLTWDDLPEAPMRQR